MTASATAETLALFPADPYRADPEPSAPDDRTRGQRLRDRQAARIVAGLHPLSLRGVYIRLHPAVPPDPSRDDGGDYPRCGTCRFRVLVGGRGRAFPKCLVGYRPPVVQTAPRYSGGDATDVRAWWPGCGDWEPKDGQA